MEQLPAKSPLVVVVDDDPWIRDMVMIHLELQGFACRSYDSADAYLGSPDVDATACLIVDANLPRVDGLELQRRLIEAKHRFPIIFYTGQINPREAAKAIEAGAEAYVEKAASPTVLIEAITHALARFSRDAKA